MSMMARMNMDSLGLAHKDPSLFATAQWGRLPPPLYVLYRVLVAMFFVTWILLSGFVEYNWYQHEEDRVKWFIYLTNWSFTLLTVCTLVQAACALYHYVSQRTRVPNREYLMQRAEMPWPYKVSWVLYNISCTAALLVTILFWVFIFPTYSVCPNEEVSNSCGKECTPTCMDPEPQCASEGECVKRCQCPQDAPIWFNGTCVTLDECPMLLESHNNATPHLAYQKTKVWKLHSISIVTHAGNSIYVLTNIWITAMPMNILHFWHFSVYALTYVLFSILYYQLGGTNAYHKHYIYNVLDWQSPHWTFGLSVGCFLLGFLLWLILFGATSLRIYIHRKWFATGNAWTRKRGQSLAVMLRESESSFTEDTPTPELCTPPFEKSGEYDELDPYIDPYE